MRSWCSWFVSLSCKQRVECEKAKHCLTFLEEYILDTLGKTISELNAQAVAAYTPMVEDVCTRKM